MPFPMVKGVKRADESFGASGDASMPFPRRAASRVTTEGSRSIEPNLRGRSEDTFLEYWVSDEGWFL